MGLVISFANLPASEELFFKARFKIGTADAKIKIQKENNVLRIDCDLTAYTLRIPLVNLNIQSLINENEGTLLYQERDLIKNHKKKWTRNLDSFDLEVEKTEDDIKKSKVELTDFFVQDILAAIYSLRSQKMEIGKQYLLKTFRRVFPISATLNVDQITMGLVPALSPEPRPQVRLSISIVEGEELTAKKILSDHVAVISIDQETGIISLIEVKPLRLPLIKVELVERKLI